MEEQAQKKKAPRLKHDGTLTISIGQSRKSTSWKPKQLNWSELVDRLQHPTITQETLAEYKRMSKAQQSEVKDVGGFVGGALQGGRRTADAVRWRQLVTLDADYCTGNLWDSVELLLDDCAAAMYTTHSHTPESPRVRLLVPLSRQVNPDEYAAVSRRIAADLGIDQFDDTTFEPHRLMFFPSAASDAEYLTNYQDGEWLDVDETLARYDDWTDPLSLPMSSRQKAAPARLAKKQGDPTTKPGLIGAFCRAYDVEDAIEKFLTNEYERHSDGRFTYAGGSTAGGLVVYDDGLFAYSHHGTDPLSGQLVNAFDLVRVHLFRELDEDAPAETRAARLPSFKAMQELAQGDDETLEQLARERMAAAAEDFLDALDDEEDEEGVSWARKLTHNKQGAVEETRSNLLLILEHDPALAGKFALDLFSNKAHVLGDLPWRKKKKGNDYFADFDDAGLRNYLERLYGISAVLKTEDALAEIMNRHAFHPVQEYLAGLIWDGVPRVERLLVDYLGAADTELNRAVTRKTMAAAVARIMEPGCKMDYMLTLIGPQGIGKSSIWNKLGGAWFSDSLTSVTGKEAYEQLQGAWIVEMGELSATRRADVESIKHFLTKQVDRFRVAYGRRVADFPRQCIFIGTTNDSEFLSDQTGNRRFWVVPVSGIGATKKWQDMDSRLIDQIWAEAVGLYDAGEPLYLERHLEIDMQDEQANHAEDQPLVGVIEEHLAKPVPVNFQDMTLAARKDFFADAFDLAEEDDELVQRDRVCLLEIWVEVMNGNPAQLPVQARREIRDALKRVPGWSKYTGNARGRMRFTAELGVQQGYVRDNFES